MINIEVKRGDRVESRHDCSVAVVDADGHLVAEFGNIYDPVFPRSSVKAIQALPLVESGAADRFGLSDADLALCCSSHSGEDRHAARALEILQRAGFDESALNCGADWPSEPPIARQYAAAGGTARPLRHNCSGKHAGFLCLACHLDAETDGYHQPDHEIQQRIKSALEDVTGFELTHPPAIDGCSIPTHAIPLRALAHGFARLATGNGLSEGRAISAKRLLNACMSKPDMVGGIDRYDTRIMAGGEGSVFAKTGAEGMYCGALPDEGFGIAVKCHDGSTRAAEIAFGCAVAAFHGDVMEHQDQLPILNAAGTPVGEIRQSGDFYKWVYPGLQLAKYKAPKVD